MSSTDPVPNSGAQGATGASQGSSRSPASPGNGEGTSHPPAVPPPAVPPAPAATAQPATAPRIRLEGVGRAGTAPVRPRAPAPAAAPPWTKDPVARVLGFGTLLVVLVMASVPLWMWAFGVGWTNRGVFGDMFGMANALFSGLGFVGVCAALYLQHRELKNSHEIILAEIASRAAPVLVASVSNKTLFIKREASGAFSAECNVLVENFGADPAVYGALFAWLRRESGDAPSGYRESLSVAIPPSTTPATTTGGATTEARMIRFEWTNVTVLDGFLSADGTRRLVLEIELRFDSAFGGQFVATQSHELAAQDPGRIGTWIAAGNIANIEETVVATCIPVNSSYHLERHFGPRRPPP